MPRTKSRTKTVTVNTDVDVELTEEDFIDWLSPVPDNSPDRRALSDWHDKAHGLNLWANCPYEPCNLLSTGYRETP